MSLYFFSGTKVKYHFIFSNKNTIKNAYYAEIPLKWIINVIFIRKIKKKAFRKRIRFKEGIFEFICSASACCLRRKE